MNHRFTPGPWAVMVGTFGKRHDPKSATVYATHDDLVYVSRCDGSQMMFHEEVNAIANAQLISAAPDLLEALELCTQQLLLPLHLREESIAVAKAKAAIIKAVAEQI